MSNQIVISSGAKVRELNGVLTGTSGVVNALGINVPSGIPQLDGSGKILVSQLPNSVMEYKGTWNAATNTPTLADGTGNQGDVYLCNVAGTVNFGSGPIAFFVGDQVIYSGTIWQRASGATGTVTSVAVTESGDALTITGSPITTSGTINIGFTGNSGQYVNGAGGLTTFPTDNITGSGASGQVTYFNGTNTITGENSFNYDASNNRLGVNTTVPNATIGANAGTDSGYSLLLKNDNANYNGIGFGTDSTYGNLIATEKLGTAPARNLTLLNQSGYISLTETGNLGVNILNPNTGIDIYNSTTSSLWLHTATSGTSGTDGVRLALFNTNGANLRNFDGSFSITAEGDFSIITIGAENFRVNSADGSIYQSRVANAMLKSVSGVITAAVAGTDYVAPASLSSYVPYTGATTNVNLGTFDLTADVITGATGSFASSGGSDTFAINHSSGSGIALNITKGGNGEGLYINKTSGSGNAATIIGTLNATTIVKSGGTSSQYLMADGSVTTSAGFITGSGVDGRVPYFNGTSSITSEAGFIYDASTNRLGVNTSVPNATIGADSALDSGYGLLIKTGASNYNGIGIAIDSTYGNLISTEKLGSAVARNLTLLNQSGFVSLKENGNFGVNTLNPAVSGTGIDVYSSTSTGIRFHTATSGLTVNDGAGINFSAANNLGITNYENGTIDIVTNGNSGVFVAANGFVGINGATPSVALTVTGAITQTSVTSALLKTNSGGLLVAAIAGTDYVAPSALSGYVPTSRTITINGNTQNLTGDISYSVGTLTGNGSSGRIPFYTGSQTFGNNDNLFWDNTNGYFGVNNTPEVPIDVTGLGINVAGTNMYIVGRFLRDNSATFKGIGLGYDNSSQTGIIYADTASGASNIAFWTYSGSSYGEKMRITGAGNVGIGMPSPFAIADINTSINGSSSSALQLGVGGTRTGQFFASSTEVRIGSVTSVPLRFFANDAEAMRITSGGNVGIGTTDGTTGSGRLRVNNSIRIVDANPETNALLITTTSTQGTIETRYPTPLVFGTDGSERMRITSGGKVRINSTADLNGRNSTLQVSGDEPMQIYGYGNGYGYGLWMCPNPSASGTHYPMSFRNPSNVEVGYISSNSSNTTFSTSGSDFRLKNSIEDWTEEVLPYFNNIKPKTFYFNTDEEGMPKTKGYIAQDNIDKFPEAYPINADGFYTFNPDGMVVYLMKAFQEQINVNNELKSQIEELKQLIKNK
jgi:hypothetical protein